MWLEAWSETMKKLIRFLIESKQELSKVVWPTRSESVEMTVAVIVIVLAVSVYIGGIDFGLTKLLTFLLKN